MLLLPIGLLAFSNTTRTKLWNFMLSFDLISIEVPFVETKMPFAGRQSLSNRVKTSGRNSEHHIWMILLRPTTVFEDHLNKTLELYA